MELVVLSMGLLDWSIVWVKVFNGSTKICGREPLKNQADHITSANFTWSILEYLDPYDRAITRKITKKIRGQNSN